MEKYPLERKVETIPLDNIAEGKNMRHTMNINTLALCIAIIAFCACSCGHEIEIIVDETSAKTIDEMPVSPKAEQMPEGLTPDLPKAPIEFPENSGIEPLPDG